jgi:hypothetical protein
MARTTPTHSLGFQTFGGGATVAAYQIGGSSSIAFDHPVRARHATLLRAGGPNPRLIRLTENCVSRFASARAGDAEVRVVEPGPGFAKGKERWAPAAECPGTPADPRSLRLVHLRYYGLLAALPARADVKTRKERVSFGVVGVQKILSLDRRAVRRPAVCSKR